MTWLKQFFIWIFFLISYFSRMEENPKVGESLLSKVLFLVCPPISCRYFQFQWVAHCFEKIQKDLLWGDLGDGVIMLIGRPFVSQFNKVVWKLEALFVLTLHHWEVIAAVCYGQKIFKEDRHSYKIWLCLEGLVFRSGQWSTWNIPVETQ